MQTTLPANTSTRRCSAAITTNSAPCPHQPIPEGAQGENWFCVFHVPANEKQNAQWQPRASLWEVFLQRFTQFLQERVNSQPNSDGQMEIDFTGFIFPPAFNIYMGNIAVPGDRPSNFIVYIFKHVIFVGSTTIAALSRPRSLNFDDVTFNGTTGFSGLTVSRADFSEITVREEMKFEVVEFENANFLRSNFLAPVTFSTCGFGEWTFGELTRFSAGLHFSNCHFDRGLKFDKTVFNRPDTSRARERLRMDITSISSHLIFSKIFCDHDIDFYQSTFKCPVLFENSRITRTPPVIDTNFDSGIKIQDSEILEAQEDDYRKLKKLSEDHGDHWQATFYYGEELDLFVSRLKPLERLLSLTFWYSCLNDYGRDLFRPVIYLIAIWYLSTAFYAITDGLEIAAGIPSMGKEITTSWQVALAHESPLQRGAIYSARVIGLVWLVEKPSLIAKSTGVWAVAVTEGIFAILLEAMWILSIRRRFRIQSY
jgi:hypothetical protein